MVFKGSVWLVAAGAVAAGTVAAGLAAGGGYALRAATADTFDPLPAPEGAASPSAEDSPGEEAAPLGNDAGLSYTRLDGASYLRVIDGRPVARLTPVSAETGGGAVTLTFTGEYLAQEGELGLEPEQFFHYAASETPQTGDLTEAATVYAQGDSPLATLSPDNAEQRFTLTLPGAPEEGTVSYFAETDEQEDAYYRLPICYEAGEDFTSEREECEEVPDPASF